MKIQVDVLKSVGIIVSIIWLVGVIGYGLNHEAQDANNYFKIANELCDSTLQQRNDAAILIERKEDRVAQQAANRARWKACRDDIRDPYRQLIAAVYKRAPLWLAAGFGTTALGWLVAWFGIVIARRIKRRVK